MKLFLVHCGYYDSELSSGIYEHHVNYLVVAPDFAQAKARAKTLPEYTKKRMHVDGMQEIEAVQGFRLSLSEDPSLRGESISRTMSYKDIEAMRGQTA